MYELDEDNLDDLENEQKQKEIIAQIKLLKKPKLLLILSGKRKCGKDFVERILMERFPNIILSFRISAPIKREYARRHNLNYEELLTASQYKESFRKQMVEWSETIRKQDPHYFLRLSLLDSYQRFDGENCLIWILNDARRPSDLLYFDPNQNEIDLTGCQMVTIRVLATEQVRKNRGWIFTEGIDDQTTECGLDNHKKWDYLISNNGTKEDLLEQLSPVLNVIENIVRNNA